MFGVISSFIYKGKWHGTHILIKSQIQNTSHRFFNGSHLFTIPPFDKQPLTSFAKRPISSDVNTYMKKILREIELLNNLKNSIELKRNIIMEKIITDYAEYINDPRIVYKMCNDKYLVFLKKTPNTTDNESRMNIIPEYAKHRASELKVLGIINLYDVEEDIINDKKKLLGSTVKEIESIKNTYLDSFNQSKDSTVTYTIGEIVEPNKYDTKKTIVCSNGIHYFKSLLRTLYYRKMPIGYTGTWLTWDEDGELYNQKNYTNGKLNHSIIFNDDGSMVEINK